MEQQTPQKTTTVAISPLSLTPTQQASTPSKRIPRPLIVLLLFFPITSPLAWVLMWRDTTYHHWFAKLLLLSGLLTLFLPLLALMLFRQTQELATTLELPLLGAQQTQFVLFLSLAFCLLQLLYAFYVQKRTKRGGRLTAVQLLITLVFLTSNLYVTVIGPLLVVQLIYQLTTGF